MQSMKILWIEDDAIKLRGLIKPLEKDGHTILIAEDLTEALKLIENFDFNLIIVDLIIPMGVRNDMGNDNFVGLKLIKILKETKISTPIMVLSVVNDSMIHDEIRKMGVNKIFQKGSLLPSLLKKEIYDFLGIEKT